MRTTAIAFNLIILCMLLGSCGPSARQRTIATALTATNSARDGFIAWDKRHQSEIVRDALTKDDALMKLAKYHARREPVIKAFEAMYRAIAIAAVVNGDPKSVANLIEAAKQLQLLIKAFVDG